MGFPPMGRRSLADFDFMRLPSPAASMTPMVPRLTAPRPRTLARVFTAMLSINRVLPTQAAIAILNTELMVKTKVIQEELETRKLVEKAKEVLMRRRNMKGDEAYRWIQKRSMDSRKSMRNVAEAILLSDEI